MSSILTDYNCDFNTFSKKNNKKKRYFKIPLAFFDSNTEISKISNGAKVLYSLLRDFTNLSLKNKICDNNGNVYIFFTREKAENYLGYSNSTVNKFFKELKKFDLIHEIRQGFKKANKIYVKEFYFDNNNKLTTQFINTKDNSRVVNLLYKKHIKVNYSLFIDTEIKNKLTNDAKILYALLLYKEQLSVKKKFTDNNGHVCINFTRKEAQEYLNCSKDKICKLFRELTDNNLIAEVRQRLTLPNIIYLSDFNRNLESKEVVYKQETSTDYYSKIKVKKDNDCYNENLKNSFKEQIGYNFFELLSHELEDFNIKIVDKIIDVMCNTINTKKKYFKINNKDIHFYDVILKILEIKSFHISKIVNNYIANAHNIVYPDAYILSMLYNIAVETRYNKEYLVGYKQHKFEIADLKANFAINEINKYRYSKDINILINSLLKDIDFREYLESYEKKEIIYNAHNNIINLNKKLIDFNDTINKPNDIDDMVSNLIEKVVFKKEKYNFDTLNLAKNLCSLDGYSNFIALHKNDEKISYLKRSLEILALAHGIKVNDIDKDLEIIKYLSDTGKYLLNNNLYNL